MPPPGVVADNAVAHCQRALIVQNPAAGVAADGAVAHRQHGTMAINAGALVAVAVTDSKAVNGDGFALLFLPSEGLFAEAIDVKHTTLRVGVHCQIIRAGPANGDIFVHVQLAADQRDGAGDASGVNRVTVIRDGERVAQRAGTAVIRVCDYNDVIWQRIAESH